MAGKVYKDIFEAGGLGVNPSETIPISYDVKALGKGSKAEDKKGEEDKPKEEQTPKKSEGSGIFPNLREGFEGFKAKKDAGETPQKHELTPDNKTESTKVRTLPKEKPQPEEKAIANEERDTTKWDRVIKVAQNEYVEDEYHNDKSYDDYYQQAIQFIANPNLLTDEGKEAMNELWASNGAETPEDKAKVFANAMSSNIDENSAKRWARYVFKAFPTDEVIDPVATEDALLNSIKKTDEEGHTYYNFVGHRVYDEKTARSIISGAIEQHNHPMMMRDSETYRDKFAQKNGFKNFEEYRKARYEAEIEPLVQAASDAYERYYDANRSTFRVQEIYADAGYGIPVMLPHQTEAGGLGELKLKAKRVLDPTYWKGLAAGTISSLRLMANDYTGVLMDIDTASALERESKGEMLSPKEEMLVAKFRAEEAIERVDQEINTARPWGRIGEGTVIGLGYMVNVAMSGGFNIWDDAASVTAKEAALQETKRAIKKGLLKEAKLQAGIVARNVGKEYGIYSVNKVLPALTSVFTAQNTAQNILGNYGVRNDKVVRVGDKGVFEAYAKGALSTYNEFLMEGAGNFAEGLLDIGRAYTTNLFVKSLNDSKVGSFINRFGNNRYTRSAVNTFRSLNLQSFPVEVATEKLTDITDPLVTGEFQKTASTQGVGVAYAQHIQPTLTTQAIFETAMVSGLLSGVGSATSLASAVATEWKIYQLRKEANQIICSISNQELKGKLAVAMETGDFSGLANINFRNKDGKEGISPADVSSALKYTHIAASIHSIQDVASETNRLETFAPVIMSIASKAYQGVDMANPAPTTDVVTATTVVDGKEVELGNVIFGDFNNPYATVQVADANGNVFNVPVQGTTFTSVPMSDAIAETYSLMFSESIAKERLDEVMANVRSVAGLSDEAYNAMLEANGFSVYKAGDEVTLTNGQVGTVKGGASNGRYLIETTDQNGQKSVVLAGFESILHETNDDMAEAQFEAQGNGEIAEPIELPTDKNGNVSFDQIEDGGTLAAVLPSQVGGVQNAVDIIDNEVARLKEQQVEAKKKGVGLDSAVRQRLEAEETAKRIAVLEDARQRLASESTNLETNESVVEPTAEQKELEREEREARMDAMSTFDFSREYRNRMADAKVAGNTLMRFITNIENALYQMKQAEAQVDAEISAVEKQIEDAYSVATSEADIERIAEQTVDLQQKLDELKAEKADIEIERRVQTHRKAQYEQTLKDMGAKDRKTLGDNKKLKRLVEKASEVLGLPIVIGEADDFPDRRVNAKHDVRDGKNVILINPNATDSGNGVAILAHEITHEFKQFLKPEEWAQFEDLVNTARFGADWRNSEEYNEELNSIHEAQNKIGKPISDAKAQEEVVTYGIETLIFEGKKGARAFEAIIRKHEKSDTLMGIWRKIVDALKNIFSFEGTLTEEEQKVKDAIDEFDKIFVEYAKKNGKIEIKKVGDTIIAEENIKNGNASYSLSTYEDGGRDTLKNFLGVQVATEALTSQEADQILSEMDTIYNICMEYKDEYSPFGEWSEAKVVRDERGVPVFSVIKQNGDYAMNLDFSLVCKKRRTLDAVLNEMIGRGLIDVAPDDPTFIASINDIIRKYGFETACRLCFVDAKRFRVIAVANDFCNMYNGVVKKLIPAGKDIPVNYFDFVNVGYEAKENSLDTMPDSELNIAAVEEIPAKYGERKYISLIAKLILANPQNRKFVSTSDFVSTRGFDPAKAVEPELFSIYNRKKGSGGPKPSHSDVQYLNDIIHKAEEGGTWTIENAYAVGGVRLQSFSDYVPRMVFDYMQMVADLAANKFPVHAYTKEALFAKTFGLTGIKINMSLVPSVVEGGVAPGLDADGNYAWQEGETFDYDTAVEIQNAEGYRENCGTIAVGVSDAHIDKMLDDENIRMIIPYHKSGLNKRVAVQNNIDKFKDYTNEQNTRHGNGTKIMEAEAKTMPNFNEDTRKMGSPKLAADAYLAWCKDNGYKPKFDKWASHPNYYKLLEDFTTLVDGEYFEQRGVEMKFPTEDNAFGSLPSLIKEGLEEDAVLEGNRSSLVGVMVDEIEQTLYPSRKKESFSLNREEATAIVETKANPLNKLPEGNRNVVDSMDVESYSISRNNEATIDKWFDKRGDFTEETKAAFKTYIADFKPATQLATAKWYVNGVIRLPEDMPKVEQAMTIAQKAKVDALQFNSPMEVIDQFGEQYKPKEKLINPDDVPTLTNKVKVPNTDITIYDVEDSEESRVNFRNLMNSHLGKDANPWCLMQADEEGKLTSESARYWKHYNKYPKRAAFKDGKVIGFFASDSEPTWWDRMDAPHSEIPVMGKIKGDALGRTATILYNERGEMAGYDNIHKGDKQNGLYEEWYNLEQLRRRGTFKNGRREGIFESWFPNGVRQTYVEFEDDFTGKIAEQWNENNILVRREIRNDNGLVGARAYWNNSGGWRSLTAFMTKPNGEISQGTLNWDTKGALVNLENYTDDLSDKWNFSFLKYEWRNGKERKVYDWAKKVFYSNVIREGVESITLSNHKNVRFADGVVYDERNGVFSGVNIVDLQFLIVGNYRCDINIANSTDGKSERITISRYNPVFPSDTFATIENGKVELGQDATDAMVDEIMAEVTKRLDLVDMVALEVQEDAKREKARAEKIREMYHADKVADIESIEDVDKMLEKISNDLASTKESFSIDRSPYLEGIDDGYTRSFISNKMDGIDNAVKASNYGLIGRTASVYERLAKKAERRAKRLRTDFFMKDELDNAKAYRAIADYGRASLKENSPEYLNECHADNLKSGSTTLSYMSLLFDKYNKNEERAELFKFVMSSAKQFGTKVKFKTIADVKVNGEQQANMISYDVDTFNSDTVTDDSKAKVILHELIHAVTASGILLVKNPTLQIQTGITPTAQLRGAVRRLERVFDSIRKDDAFKGEYGAKNVDEMLAEMANVGFVEKLKAHDIWTRIVNGIREVVLAIGSIITGNDYVKGNAYAEVRNSLTEMVKETPLEWMGMVNQVRDRSIGKSRSMDETLAEPLTETEIASLAESEGTTSYSIVRDEAKIAELEASPKRIGYRNMVLNEDGTLSAPMAASLSYPSRKKDTEMKMSVSELGKWEQADEHPELVNEKGKITIYQPENGAGTTVNYDPYIHSRQDRVNTQLKGAWRRPNLVYVEVEIPTTDLESGYQADKAALPVGAHEWAGGSGIVMLSMYDKPIRIADWNDVADDWMKRFGNEPIHFDIIPPQLLPILAERGANISSPHPGLGADVYDAYEAFKAEQGVSYSISVDKAEFDAVRDLAVENVGIVMPNLAEKNVKVVRYEDSDKRIPKGLDDEEIRKWAHANVVTEDSEIIDSDGVVHNCPITRQSINEIMHRDTMKNSVSKRVHILALPLLPKILSNSIEVEIHPDYNKVGKERKPEYGYNPSLLMHRFYGAVEIEGVVYRTKTIVKEYKDKNTALKPYAYEVTKIELLPYSTTDATNAHSRLLNIDNNSISATKLLQNVEKSYDSGKKVLDESAKLPEENYSLNRDEIDTITVATPEVVAEANEELSREMELIEQLDEAQTALDRLRRKIDKRNERKELTFDEVRKFLLDGDTLQGLQEASAGQYKRIITNVLNTLEKMPEKRIAVNKLVDKVQEALTSARLNVANSNLKAASKDFANVIKKKREGKNSRGEVVAKSVDNETRKIMQEFESTIESLFTYDGKVDWKKVLEVGEKVSDFLDTKIAELEDTYSQNGDASTLGLLNLLEAFKVVRDRTNDVQAILKDQKDIKSERNSIEETLSTLEELLNTYYAGGRDFGKAKRELKALGYTIAQADNAVDKLKRDHRATTIDMRSAKLEECNAKSALIDAVRDMNTAIQSLDKEGRVALKEEVAERKEEKRVFRNGVLRSIRNPLFRNTIDYNAKDRELKTASGDAYNWWKKYLLNRGGDAIVSEGVDTFEYRCRRMDVMSVPNAWLHDGLYYQFMLHPEKGFLARSDWRYHTERELRARLDEAVKQFTGFNSVDKLKGTLNSESPFIFEVFRTDKDGKVLSDVTIRTLTINEVLYIRSAVRQDGAIRGYLAIGLTEDYISDIVDWVEYAHSSLCDLCDWVQSEGGIMEEMYAMRNADYRRINGVDLSHTEWYFPLKRVADVLPSQETVGDAIPTSALANGIGSNKARTRNVVPMDLNAGFFSVLDSHIAESVQWTAYADLFDKMNTLLGSPMFKKMLKVQGVTLSKFKDSFLRAAGERLGEGESDFIAKAVGSFTKNAVAANVVGNLNTALKQMASITAGLSRDFNPKLWGLFVKNFPIITNLSTAVEKGWRKYKGDNIYKEMDVVRSNFTWAMQNVPTFAERVDTETMGMDIFKQDGFQRWDEVSGWVKKIGMAPNRFMDIVVSAAVAKTVYEFEYEKKRKRGLSHEEAHNDARMEAALVVNQTQQSDQGAFLSSWQADKKDTVGKVLSTGFTAYNNSQLAFDRNARAAFLELMGLSFDGGNKDRVRYLTEEYERRGLDYREAKKYAVKDLREAFVTQLNTYLHNAFINPVVWVAMPTMAMLTTALVQSFRSDDDEEKREFWDIIKDEMKKALSLWNLVYLIPGTTTPIVKDAFDMLAQNGFDFKQWSKTLRMSRSGIVLQPFVDLMMEVAKYLKEKGKEESIFGKDVESKVPATAMWLAVLDTATRYGIGMSSKTMTRFGKGMYDAAVNGELEDFMNATNQSKVLTKLMASRIRKGESMEDYIARVGGAYRVINAYFKGADTRELRKQYIDKMDATIIRENGNPFDYEAYKENKKIVLQAAKSLVISIPYDGENNEYGEPKPKEGKEEILKSLTKEDKQAQAKLARCISKINYLQKQTLDIPTNLNWDEKKAKYRVGQYEKLNNSINQFLEIWESNPELRNKLNIRNE